MVFPFFKNMTQCLKLYGGNFIYFRGLFFLLCCVDYPDGSERVTGNGGIHNLFMYDKEVLRQRLFSLCKHIKHTLQSSCLQFRVFFPFRTMEITVQY